MTPQETVILTRYVKACCPGSQIDEYTPDAWHDLLGDLPLDDCRAAVTAVAKRQPFVAPSEIRAEVKRIRDDRIARNPVTTGPAELANEPGRYQRIVQANVKRIADGFDIRPALGGGKPLEGDPPQEWQEAVAAIEAAVKPAPADKQALARQQVEEIRRQRESEAS